MNSISSLGAAAQATPDASLQRSNESLASVNSPSSTENDSNAAASSTVRISETGRALSLQNQAGNAVGSEGGSSEAARKALLKQIEQLREQIQQKQQELAKLMANDSLSREQKEAQVNAAQSEIRTLQGALTAAQNMLLKIEQEKLQNSDL